MPGHLAELAAIATGTALMIVAQLAAVLSMTVLSAWGSASQRWRWWPAWGVTVTDQPGVISFVWPRAAAPSS